MRITWRNVTPDNHLLLFVTDCLARSCYNITRSSFAGRKFDCRRARIGVRLRNPAVGRIARQIHREYICVLSGGHYDVHQLAAIYYTCCCSHCSDAYAVPRCCFRVVLSPPGHIALVCLPTSLSVCLSVSLSLSLSLSLKRVIISYQRSSKSAWKKLGTKMLHFGTFSDLQFFFIKNVEYWTSRWSIAMLALNSLQIM